MSGSADDPRTRPDPVRTAELVGARNVGFKEWLYFCAATPEVDVRLCFTLLGRLDPQNAGRAPAARVVALARTHDARWYGGVDEVPSSAVHTVPGRVDLTMGSCGLRFRAGAYAINVKLASVPLEAHLRIRPLALPVVGTSVRSAGVEPIHWIVVPRLEVHGEIRLDGQHLEIGGAPAYHDHNWGPFSWGGDLAWEWAVVLPPSLGVPCTIVYSRIFDRARRQVLSRAILVWRDDALCRAFRDDEITVMESGVRRDGVGLHLPGDAAPPGAPFVAEVPRVLVARADSAGDRLELRLTSLDFATIALPGEPPSAGTGILCEARAEAEVTGVIRAERFSLKAPAILQTSPGAAGTRAPDGTRSLRPAR